MEKEKKTIVYPVYALFTPTGVEYENNSNMLHYAFERFREEHPGQYSKMHEFSNHSVVTAKYEAYKQMLTPDGKLNEQLMMKMSKTPDQAKSVKRSVMTKEHDDSKKTFKKNKVSTNANRESKPPSIVSPIKDDKAPILSNPYASRFKSVNKDSLFKKMAKKRVKMEVTVYDYQPFVDIVESDKFLVTFDLKNITQHQTDDSGAPPFWLFKPSVFEFLSEDDNNKEAIGDIFYNMICVNKRQQPYGESLPMLHESVSTNINKEKTSYRHEMMATFVTKSDTKTVPEQLQETIDEMIGMIAVPEFQDLFHTMACMKFSGKLPSYLMPQGKGTVQVKDSLWTNLEAGLTNPEIKYKENLRYGLLDEDIGEIFKMFFRPTVAFGNVWNDCMTKFTRGSEEDEEDIEGISTNSK